MSTSDKPRERLDVPAITPLERSLLVNKIEKPNITSMGRSSLLSRLQQFMPEMEAANKKLDEELKSKPASDFDIETISDENSQVIEMDLACGILELRDAAGVKAAEASVAGRGAIEVEEEDSESDEDEDENTSSTDLVMEESESPDDDVKAKKKAKKSNGKIIEL